MKLKGFCRKYPLATLVCSLVLVVACASFLPEDGLWSQIAKSFVLSLVALACAWPFLSGLCGKGVGKARGASFGEDSQGASIARQAEGSVEATYAGDAMGSGGAENARDAAGTESSKRADSLDILPYAVFLLAAALVGGFASAVSTASGFHLDVLSYDLGFWVWRAVQVTLLCLTTAVFEEALFRGVVFSCLVERFRACGLPIPAYFAKRVSQNSARKGSMGKGDTREGDVREGDARGIRARNDCGNGCEKEGDLSRNQECSGYGLESPESPRLPETPEAMGLPEVSRLPKLSEMIGSSKSLCLPKTPKSLGLPDAPGLLGLPKSPETPEAMGLSKSPKALGLSETSKSLGLPGLAEVAAAALSAILFGLLHVSASDMEMIARSLESLASMGLSGDSATFSQLQLSLVLSAQMIFKIAQASLFGFCMAALFAKTRSLLAPVVVHAVFDVFYLGPQVFLTGALPDTYMTGNCVDLAILGLTIALLLPPSFKSTCWFACEVVPYSSFNRQKRWFDKGSA